MISTQIEIGRYLNKKGFKHFSFINITRFMAHFRIAPVHDDRQVEISEMEIHANVLKRNYKQPHNYINEMVDFNF